MSEWIFAASAGLDTTKYKYGVENEAKHASPVCVETFSKDTTGQSHPFAVRTGQKNGFNIYNMCGNVAELVDDADFVFGGSFKEPSAQCTVTSKQDFTTPQSNIGFRVVAVIRGN